MPVTKEKFSSEERRFELLVGSSSEAKTEFISPYYEPSYEFPWNPDKLVGGNSYKIYDDMRVDDQVKASLHLKKNFVLCSGWEIDCENEEIRDALTENLNNLGDDSDNETTFNDILMDILSAYDYGFSLSEPIYKLRDGKWILKTIKVRPPHSFLFHIDDKGNIKDIEQYTTKENLHIKPDKLFHHIYQPEFGNPFGRSDLKAAYPAWTAKKYVDRFLNVYLERFAAPTKVIKGRAGMDANEAARCLDILKSIQNVTDVVIPDGTTIEFVQASKDSSEAYMKALDYYNRRISRSLLVPDLVGIGGGETKGGSFALGKKHLEVFLATIKYDRDSLEKRINSKIIKTMVSLNYGDKIECRFKFLPPTSDDVLEYAKIWNDAVKGHIYKPSDEEVNHFRNILGFPEGDVERPEPRPIAPFPGKTDGADKAGVTGKKEDIDPDDLDDKEEFISRDPNMYEKKINFKQMEKSLDKTEKRITGTLDGLGKEIYSDVIEQVRRKGLLKKFQPERLKEVQPRYLKKMETSFRLNFVDLFKESYSIAQKELFPNQPLKYKANVDLLPQEFIDVIKAESFETVGDYATQIKKKTKNILMEGIKTGTPEGEVVKLLRDELQSTSERWLSTVVRTKSTEVFNKARRIYWETDPLAKEVVTAYEFSAIMDDRTSDICSSLDGKIFNSSDAAMHRMEPPLHFNCRSVLVPVTKFEDYTTVPIPSKEDVKSKGGNLKTFQIEDNEFIATGKVETYGETLVITSPGEGKRIEIIAMWVSNISVNEPVNVSFRESNGGNDRFADYLDKAGGQMTREFGNKPFPLTDNTGLNINLSANVMVEFSVIYTIKDINNG